MHFKKYVLFCHVCVSVRAYNIKIFAKWFQSKSIFHVAATIYNLLFYDYDVYILDEEMTLQTQ